MPHANWRLTCAGNYERDARTTNHVRHMIDELGLGDRVTLAGDLDAPVLAQCYDTADVFVLASRQETFGMAVAEAGRMLGWNRHQVHGRLRRLLARLQQDFAAAGLDEELRQLL